MGRQMSENTPGLHEGDCGNLHTNERMSIAEPESVIHQDLCIDAAILITITGRCENRLIYLKVDKWRGGGYRFLALVKDLVRRRSDQKILQRTDNEDAQKKKNEAQADECWNE